MRRWTAAVAVLPCAVACSSGPADRAVTEESLDLPPTVREAEPVPGIEGEAVQLRTDVAAGGRIQVRITASDTFTVTSVALHSPGFSPQPPREVATDFVPGQVTDLRTPIGPARCDLEPQPASALLTVARDGRKPQPVEVPLAADVLDRIHAAECAEQALAQEVTVLVGDLRVEAEGLSGSLALLRRSGDREARVTRILRSVLVAVEADLPLTLGRDETDAATDVRFAPATCEPHVLADTKQPFRFPVTVQLGDAGPVTVDLPIADGRPGPAAGDGAAGLRLILAGPEPARPRRGERGGRAGVGAAPGARAAAGGGRVRERAGGGASLTGHPVRAR